MIKSVRGVCKELEEVNGRLVWEHYPAYVYGLLQQQVMLFIESCTQEVAIITREEDNPTISG